MKQRLMPKKVTDVRPVQRIELSEKHTGLRIAATVLAIAIAVGATGYAVSRLISHREGWNQIKPAASSEKNLCGELIFEYDLGLDGASPSAEYKKISRIYTDASAKAYRLFNEREGFPDCKNPYYLSRHPNEDVAVEEPLYRALCLMKEKGGRLLYLAPVYSRYEALFSCTCDEEAIDFDPVYNKEAKDFIDTALKFAGDESAVSVELLGDNKVRLNVSDEYARYAKEERIEYFIDFFWLRNAFAADYAAEELNAKGYTHGIITSYDGFSRHLGQVSTPLSYNIFEKSAGGQRVAAIIPHRDHMNIVRMRSYPKSTLDVLHYYTWENGDVRGPYIDPKDGLAKAAISDLVAYSYTEGCAETALDIFDLYASDTFDRDEAAKLPEQGVELVYCGGDTVYHSDSRLEPYDLYKNGTESYRSELIK